MNRPPFAIVWTLASTFAALSTATAQGAVMVRPAAPAAPQAAQPSPATAPIAVMRTSPQRQDPTPAANVRRELRKILAEVDKQDLSDEQKAMVRKAIEKASAKVLSATPPPPPAPAPAATSSKPAAKVRDYKPQEEVLEVVIGEKGDDKAPEVPRKITWRAMEGAPSAGGTTVMRLGEAQELGKRRVFQMEGGKAIAIEGGEGGEFRVVEGRPITVRTDKDSKPMVFRVEGGRGMAVQSTGPELRVVESKPVEVQVEVENPRIEVVRKRMAEQQREAGEQIEKLSRELQVVRERANAARVRAEAVRERAEEAREQADQARRKAEVERAVERAQAVEVRGRDVRPAGQEAELRAMVEQMRAE
ncbi:MAG: hypothetical protein RL398_923, partial [Planctomycetota bacterium]